LINMSIGIDGATAEDVMFTNTSGTTPMGFAFSHIKAGSTIGYHYATLLNKISAGTATYEGNATAGTRCALSTTTRG
jgi:hypothetical protein